MFTHYRTEGVVLRTRQTREADEIFTLYTKEFGKIDVIGRSIRKSRSKLRMNMSLFSYVEIGFIQGKSYNTLTDVVLVSDFGKTKKTLGKLSLFYRISEVLLSLVYGQEKDEKIFLFLLKSFQKIEETNLSREKIELFFCFFSFRLLYFLGYKVYIEKCVFCKEKIDGAGYFNPREGGVVCGDCFGKDPAGIPLEDVKSLQCFFGNDLAEIFNQNPKTFLNILENYLAFIPELKK